MEGDRETYNFQSSLEKKRELIEPFLILKTYVSNTTWQYHRMFLGNGNQNDSWVKKV